jgi:hypothetical protein
VPLVPGFPLVAGEEPPHPTAIHEARQPNPIQADLFRISPKESKRYAGLSPNTTFEKNPRFRKSKVEWVKRVGQWSLLKSRRETIEPSRLAQRALLTRPIG